MTEFRTDRSFLLERQYQSADNLQARISLHERFSTSSQSFPEWILDHLAAPPSADILEVGCGNGNLWVANGCRIPPGWRLTLTDFSEGMVDEARRRLGDRATFQIADVTELPFGDEAFDAVIANHMLFHVPDRSRALAEIARVLRRRGLLIATTNGRGHMGELWALMREPDNERWFEQFSLENGAAQLRSLFTDVEVHRFGDGLEVTEVEPLLAFVRSLVDREHRLSDVAERAAAAIACDGAFRVTKSVGLFRCRKP